ncbi:MULTISPECIES: CE1759 family FMN reductase [Streptomyces]|uniref:FMN reductase n=1 Tax=Streptomyces melanosporofaciens TaxID=67327 RepID=A0A1H4ZNG4_STRMJ|nr:CE1759 family FMN reductase [Streptomyces melanosporofaciens]SED31663.1 FMN reductase [Streptomyces melanosporofaciens]
MKLAIVTGGLREPSSTRLLADRLVTAVTKELEQHGERVEASIVELRPLGHLIMDAMLTGFTKDELESAFRTVADADGIIAVTPAFNASFSGLFKSFFDVLPEQTLSDLPVLIGATGGTERHSLVLEHALRPMLTYLHAIVSPRAVYAATGDFGSQSGAALAERITDAAADFSRLLRACGPRVRREPADDDLAAMQRLLGDTTGVGTGRPADPA